MRKDRRQVREGIFLGFWLLRQELIVKGMPLPSLGPEQLKNLVDEELAKAKR